MEIRPFEERDAPELSELIALDLRQVNSRDYAADIIERMVAYFTPAELCDLARERQVVVTADATGLLGTASLEGSHVYTVFVHPNAHGIGVGRQLMDAVESIAKDAGHKSVELTSSITAREFYRKLGYYDVGESSSTFGLNYLMRKQL